MRQKTRFVSTQKSAEAGAWWKVKPYYEDSAVTIYHGDCREILPQLEPVDLVLTDPPYRVKKKVELRGVGVAQRKQKATTIGDQTGWTYTKEWLRIARVICPKHIITFAGYLDLAGLLLDWNQGELRGVFTWKKPNAAMPAWNVPRYDTEFALWFARGNNPEGMQAIRSMVIECPYPSAGCVSNGERILEPDLSAAHPAQKPLRVMAFFTNAFSATGETILDPFMGSGTTLRAAKDLGRKAIGIEIEEKYCEIAAKRMGQEVLSL